MTAPVTPEPVAPVNGVEPAPSTPEASPPRRSAGVRILVLLLSLASLGLGLLQFAGGLSEIGNLFGPGAVDSSAVASQIQSRVGTGVAICSEDLRAEVGASISCSVIGGGASTTVRATVTAVDGDDVTYQLEEVG